MAKKVKTKDLGKGIGALLGSFGDATEVPVPSQKIVQELSNKIIDIPVDSIEKNPEQPRKNFDVEALELLKNSIKTHGLIQPITVRSMGDGTYQLISGERRLRATMELGIKEIPAYIRVVNDNQEMIELALVENIHRADLNPMEVAFTYQRLKDECNLRDEDLSKRVGISRVLVTSILGLIKLPPSIQSALKDRKISRGHAISLGRVNDLPTQLDLLKNIIEKELSVRQLEALIRGHKKSSTPTSANRLPEQYQRVQNELRELIGRKIEIKAKKTGKGQITIPFDSTAEFNDIYDLLERYVPKKKE